MPIKYPNGTGHAVAGYAFTLLGALGFSVKSILVKLAYGGDHQIDAISLMALRMLFALPFFLLITVWQHQKISLPPLTKKQWLTVIVLGLMGYYLASFLDFAGLVYISAGLERVILFLYPTFVVLFSAAASRRKVSAREIAALLSSYAGLVLIFIEQLSPKTSELVFGSALVLGSAIVFAVFTMGSGVMVHRIGSARFTVYTMTVASSATVIHFAGTHQVDIGGFTTEVYFLALAMAVFSTVLPAFFMNAGIRRIGAGPASIISSTGPIATLVLAYFVLDEAIGACQWIGTVLVLAGVYIISRQ